MTRVLFVDRDYAGIHPRSCATRSLAFVARLRQEVDVATRPGLSADVISLTQGGNYDVLVTHFPYCWEDAQEVSLLDTRAWCRAMYRRSYQILQRIRQLSPATTIIVYSGADFNAHVAAMIREVADHHVTKSADWEEDAERVVELLWKNELSDAAPRLTGRWKAPDAQWCVGSRGR